MDKLSGDLRKTTWTLDDFIAVLKISLQVMEQNKAKELNSLTKLQPHSTAVF